MRPALPFTSLVRAPGGPEVAPRAWSAPGGVEVGERLADGTGPCPCGTAVGGKATIAGVGAAAGTSGAGALGVGLGRVWPTGAGGLFCCASALTHGPTARCPEGSEPLQVATTLVAVLLQTVGFALPVAATAPPAANRPAAITRAADLTATAPSAGSSERARARAATR
jgi:hypothetical protein